VTRERAVVAGTLDLIVDIEEYTLRRGKPMATGQVCFLMPLR